MPTLRQIDQVLEESTSLKLVAQAYSEISAIKLQKIRSNIEQNRNFFQEISELFHIVKLAASRKKILPPERKRGTISILLSSNHHFYGSLETQLIKFFVVNTTKFRTDRIVVGKTAMEFLKTMGYFHSFEPFLFNDDLPHLEELRSLVTNLSGYQQISVYYSRMQSVLIQEPHVVDIVQRPPDRLINAPNKTVGYIFEPELGKMLEFFDTQISLLLLEQTFLESELARTASRLISMDQAQMNADEIIRQQKKLLARARRSLENMHLLDTVATLTQWRKETDDAKSPEYS